MQMNYYSFQICQVKIKRSGSLELTHSLQRSATWGSQFTKIKSHDLPVTWLLSWFLLEAIGQLARSCNVSPLGRSRFRDKWRLCHVIWSSLFAKSYFESERNLFNLPGNSSYFQNIIYFNYFFFMSFKVWGQSFQKCIALFCLFDCSSSRTL